jgi:hypothetical protein
MASKSFSAIESDIIDNILIINPAIDIKVGTVVRDIFIDSSAAEIEILYGIVNNVSLSQSVTTAVNTQLDRLAYNYGLTRNPPVRASGTLTISIKAGVQAPTPLNIGDQFNTLADQNNAIVVFINTQYQMLTPGQVQATIPIVALNPGTSGNVGANTITQSSYDFADAVYNINPTSGGLDQETDANFALRIPATITGQYINTARGIISSITDITDINGVPCFVTPDNIQSRGPYTVDVYLQRSTSYFGTTATDTVPANIQNYSFLQQPLYSLDPINQISTFNPLTGASTIVSATNYQIINNPTDVEQNYLGSIKANQMLNWLVAPPVTPYTISYNYDHTIIDAQAAYDIHNEITADTLFKQAIAIPLYISADVVAAGSANITTLYNTAFTNLINLFNNLSITQNLTSKEIEFSILTDRNIQDIALTNFDTTYEITLTIPVTSGFLTPDNQSEITPLGFYWEVDPSTSVMSYAIAARLWIGKPDIITSTNQTSSGGFYFSGSTSIGVPSQNTITNITPSWSTNVFTFYDKTNATMLLNFDVAPAAGDTLTFSLVQSNIDISNNLAYLTLAPSIVSPVIMYAPTIQTTNIQYATSVPTGITFNQASLYQNGVQLVQQTASSIGDYQILSGPDSITGIINIQFTVNPTTTDILQYGLLNPNFNVTYSTSQFSR